MHRLLACATAVAAARHAAPLPREEPYPAKPITLAAPLPPGGVAGLAGRSSAAAREQALGQRDITENKSGAAVGTACVAGAKPDGYTLPMARSSISIVRRGSPSRCGASAKSRSGE